MKSNEVKGAGRMIERQMLLARFRQAGAGKVHQAAGRYRFITISRELGALGNFVASELAARLGWQVFDKEIVDYIAANSNVRLDLVRELDERAQNLIHDTVDRLLRMVEGVSFGNEEYHKALLKTLATFAALGNVIIVGRGGAHALQGQSGLFVRVTGSPEARVRRISERQRIPLEEAKRMVQQVDGERRGFLQHHFKASSADDRFYDLVINTDRMTVTQAVDGVLGIMQAPASACTDSVRGVMPPPP